MAYTEVVRRLAERLADDWGVELDGMTKVEVGERTYDLLCARYGDMLRYEYRDTSAGFERVAKLRTARGLVAFRAPVRRKVGQWDTMSI